MITFACGHTTPAVAHRMYTHLNCPACEDRARTVNAMAPQLQPGENWYAAAERYMKQRDELLAVAKTALTLIEGSNSLSEAAPGYAKALRAAIANAESK